MATYNTTAAIDAMLRANSAPVEAEMQAAQNNYEAAIRRLEAQKAAEDAQAYRSFERQKRELPEVMAANGAQGGMVDSAVASMENNYMNNRNARALQLADNLADQQLNYDNNMLSLRAQLAAYQQQAAADKAEAEYKKLYSGGGGGGDVEDDDANKPKPKTEEEIREMLLNNARNVAANTLNTLQNNMGGYYTMGSQSGAGTRQGKLFKNTDVLMKN